MRIIQTYSLLLQFNRNCVKYKISLFKDIKYKIALKLLPGAQKKVFLAAKVVPLVSVSIQFDSQYVISTWNEHLNIYRKGEIIYCSKLMRKYFILRLTMFYERIAYGKLLLFI